MAETLREYLIALGWKIDESSWKKYESALLHTGEATFQVGATAIATGTAIEAMVVHMARQYENLYYVSQRTGQSVQYLQTTQFGFQQIGLTADEATASIEGVAQAIRMSPGLAGMTHGETDVNKIIDQFARLPDAIGIRLAALYGISYKVYMQRKLFGKIEDEQAEHLKKLQKDTGVDPGKLATKFTVFGRSLNTLEADFGNMGAIIAQNFIDPTNVAVQKLSELVDEIERADPAVRLFGYEIKGVGETFAALGATGLGVYLLTKLLGRILRAIGVLRTVEGAAMAATEAETGAAAAGGALGVAGSVALALGGAAGLIIAQQIEAKNQSGQPVTDETRKRIAQLPWYRRDAMWLQEHLFGADPNRFQNLPGQSRQTTASPTGESRRPPLDIRPKEQTTASPTGESRRPALDIRPKEQTTSYQEEQSDTAGDIASSLGQQTPERFGGADTVPSVGDTAEDRVVDAIKFFQSQGLPRQAAIGIASGLYFESDHTMDPRAKNMAGGGEGAHGIGQWRGERLDEFRKMFGKNVEDASLREQLQFTLYELRGGADAGARKAGVDLSRPGITASESAEKFLRLSERPGPAGEHEIRDASKMAGEIDRLTDYLSTLVPQQINHGNTAHVSIHQKTDIHVTGGDARESAREVEKSQSRVNDQIVRHTQGAIG